MKLGGVVDRPDGCAAVQKDLDRLEKWSDRNLMVFNKGKRKVLPLGRVSPMHQDRLGTDQPESSFVDKGLEVLMDTKLTMRQQCALAAKKAKSLLACIRKNVASRQRNVILPLCSPLGCCVLFGGSQCKRDWMSPMKGHEDN